MVKRKNIKIVFFIAMSIAQSFSFALAKNQEFVQEQNLSFTVENAAKRAKALKCLLLSVGKNDFLIKVARVIKFDLEFTDQFDLDHKRSDQELNAKTLGVLFKKGTSLSFSFMDATKKNRKGESSVLVKVHDAHAQSVIF